ncbi:hypothetical protein ACFQMM_07755 [Saliphagus sp. GCM10025308]
MTADASAVVDDAESTPGPVGEVVVDENGAVVTRCGFHHPLGIPGEGLLERCR